MPEAHRAMGQSPHLFYFLDIFGKVHCVLWVGLFNFPLFDVVFRGVLAARCIRCAQSCESGNKRFFVELASEKHEEIK